MNPIQKLKTFIKTEEGIYRLSEHAETGASYDNKAKGYERLVKSKWYNRLMWGTYPSDYMDFSKKAILDTQGIGIDFGCGGLVQTYEQYNETDNDFVLLDNSIEMLKVAHSRLNLTAKKESNNIHLLQANAFETPFDSACFDIVCSFGVLHIFDDKEGLVTEALRILKPGGFFYFTSLTSDRFISRLYLSLLKTQGEIGEIKTSSEILTLFENCTNFDWYVKGSMLFVSGQKTD